MANSCFITVSAVVFRNELGEVLTVRKRGTSGFMLPGGKPEEDESAPLTAIREVAEELNFRMERRDLKALGTFAAPALNEAGFSVYAHVFEWKPVDTGDLQLLADLEPSAEIEEFRWVHPASEQLENQAPLNTEYIFPLLCKRTGTAQVAPETASLPAQRKAAVAVFLGSASGTSSEFAQVARSFGAACATSHITVVYGGGRTGLMGELADGAREAGGTVHGVIPQFLADKEVANTAATHLDIVQTMHERKARMAKLSDAFVALPGGPGTLEEFFEVWTWSYLGLHSKPVALLNVGGFWNPLIELCESMRVAGFMREEYQENLIIADTVEELLEALNLA